MERSWSDPLSGWAHYANGHSTRYERARKFVPPIFTPWHKDLLLRRFEGWDENKNEVDKTKKSAAREAKSKQLQQLVDRDCVAFM